MPLHIDSSVVNAIRKMSEIPCIFHVSLWGLARTQRQIYDKTLFSTAYLYGSLL